MNTPILIKQGKLLNVTNRMQEANISIIKEMMFLAEKEQRKGKSIISLGVGIPYYKMPQSIKSAVIKELQENPVIDKYTFFAGLPKLRQLIATTTTQLGIASEEGNILITPGSMASLLYSMLTLINEGDEVIIPSPYFPSYIQQISIAGGHVVEAPLIEPKDKKDTFHLDLNKIAASITKKTKAIIINSPHNPTGAVYSEKELRGLAKILKGKNIYVITDEVYDYLIYDDAKYFNIASIKSLWPYVIRCCSFSKRFGMTGWRIGYLHADKDLISYLLRIHDNTIVCAPHIAQAAVFHGLSSPSEEIKKNVRSLKKNRDLICNRLAKLPDLFTYTVPQGSYYVFPKYNLPIKSTEFALKLLYEAGIVVIPGIGFGKVGEQHLRLSYGGFEQDIDNAFDKIEKWWKNYKKR